MRLASVPAWPRLSLRDWVVVGFLSLVAIALLFCVFSWIKYELERPRTLTKAVDLYLREQDFRTAIAGPELPKSKRALKLEAGDQLHVHEGVTGGAIVDVDSGRHRGVRGWVPGKQLADNLDD